jgi:hypothetical protein
MNITRMICGIIAGLAICAGAAYSHKYYEVGGFVAFLVFIVGASIIGRSLQLPGDKEKYPEDEGF